MLSKDILLKVLGKCQICSILEAIEIISKSLRGAVENTPEGREGMALGQYVAGMGFSNVGLGISSLNGSSTWSFI